MLGLLTLLLGSFRRHRRPPASEGPPTDGGRVIDVDPE
jgi:hypothetical protein